MVRTNVDSFFVVIPERFPAVTTCSLSTGRDIPAAVFQAVRVGPVDVSFSSEPLLISTFGFAELTNAYAELFQVRIGGRARRHGPHRADISLQASLDRSLQLAEQPVRRPDVIVERSPMTV